MGVVLPAAETMVLRGRGSMYFDITWFGSGLGLVMVGYVSGMAVGIVYSLIRRISEV